MLILCNQLSVLGYLLVVNQRHNKTSFEHVRESLNLIAAKRDDSNRTTSGSLASSAFGTAD